MESTPFFSLDPETEHCVVLQSSLLNVNDDVSSVWDVVWHPGLSFIPRMMGMPEIFTPFCGELNLGIFSNQEEIWNLWLPLFLWVNAVEPHIPLLCQTVVYQYPELSLSDRRFTTKETQTFSLLSDSSWFFLKASPELMPYWHLMSYLWWLWFLWCTNPRAFTCPWSLGTMSSASAVSVSVFTMSTSFL